MNSNSLIPIFHSYPILFTNYPNSNSIPYSHPKLDSFSIQLYSLHFIFSIIYILFTFYHFLFDFESNFLHSINTFYIQIIITFKVKFDFESNFIFIFISKSKTNFNLNTYFILTQFYFLPFNTFIIQNYFSITLSQVRPALAEGSTAPRPKPPFFSATSAPTGPGSAPRRS